MIRWEWYFFQSPNCLPQLWKLPPQLKRTSSLSLWKSIWMQEDEIVLSLLMEYLAKDSRRQVCTKNDLTLTRELMITYIYPLGEFIINRLKKGPFQGHPFPPTRGRGGSWQRPSPGEKTEVISSGTFGWVRGSAIGQGAHACVPWIHQENQMFGPRERWQVSNICSFGITPKIGKIFSHFDESFFSDGLKPWKPPTSCGLWGEKEIATKTWGGGVIFIS